MTTLNSEEQEQIGVIEAAAAAGCGVLIKKALGSGHHGIDSLRLAARQPGVTSVVVGTLDPAHLRDNVAAIST